MSRLALCASCFAAALLLAADNPLEGDKFLEKADEKFGQSMQRAQDAYAKSAGDAYETRLKTYRAVLAAATKAGDFDRATAVKDRIKALEQEASDAASLSKKTQRPKPKNTVKFGGHEYALVTDPATWGQAEKLCKEMGGHLAIANTEEKLNFLGKLCGETTAYIGASDEAEEGVWRWVDGSPVQLGSHGNLSDANGMEHYLHWWPADKKWLDGPSYRTPFVCEWD